MISLGVLIFLLLAHFVADFPLQRPYVVSLRSNSDVWTRFRGNGIHTVLHFIVSLFFVIYFWSFKMVLVVVIISL